MKAKLRTFGDGGALVLANACPFGEFRSASKSSFFVLPGIERKTRMDADGKVRVLSQTRRRKECEGLLVTTRSMNEGV